MRYFFAIILGYDRAIYYSRDGRIMLTTIWLCPEILTLIDLVEFKLDGKNENFFSKLHLLTHLSRIVDSRIYQKLTKPNFKSMD